MENSVLDTLERAAQILMAPPNLVNLEQRHQAEKVFLDFRATKKPYQLCRDILEKSNSDCVLFETAILLKTALIREWSLLSEEDILSLQEYLLNYLMTHDTPPFLREKFLQIVAVIVKRCSIDDAGSKRKALIGELEKLILNSPIKQQRLACSLISALMQEHAITVKSADIGLIWDIHFCLKKSFEALELKRIFIFTVDILRQIIRSELSLQGEQGLLTKQLLNIVETILCWGQCQVSSFMPKRLIGNFEVIYEIDNAPALRLSNSWKDTILQPELISFFFKVHMYIRSNLELATSSLTCLVQLASLSGVVLSDIEIKKQYLHNYVNGFLNMMCSLQPYEREMLGIADVYRRLFQFFPLNIIATTPPLLLHTLANLTCHCIKGAAVEESINEETILRETLNKFLYTWSTIVYETDGYTNEALLDPCREVFNTYLQCRLAPPDGTRGLENSDRCGDDNSDEMEEDDRKVHNDVVLTIGAIARKAPQHCCNVLFSLLQDRSKKLETQLQLMHVGRLGVSSGEQLISLFEDLHWIIMITGHFIALDCTEGETVTIPPEIIRHSLTENKDVEASLRYLVGEHTNTNNVDAIFMLIAEIFRISSWECAALEAGLGSVFSPQLSATISWVLKIWANSYLMPLPTLYTEFPVLFDMAFGSSSSGVMWAISLLMRRVRTCLTHLGTQPTASNQALELLTTLAALQSKQNPLPTCEDFLALVAWEAEGSNLLGSQRRELHRAFAIAATYATGEPRNRLLLSTAALQEKLMNILNASSDTEPVRNMLADTLDCYIGVTEGVLEVGEMDEQFMMLIGALDKIPSIIFKYHNYPSVVLPSLNFLTKSAKRMLHSVQPQNATKFLQVCDMTFEVYVRWNSGKISKIPQDAEDEAYEDICALMDLLCNIARCDVEQSGKETCARGLRTLLPLITPPLLALPSLAQHAYKMLRDLEIADRLIYLPIEDFNMVVMAIRIGLTAVSCDVSNLCCNIIVGLANKVKPLESDNPYTLSLLSLAEILLMLVVKIQIPADSMQAAGAAIFSLTCIKPALLEALARELMKIYAADDPANVSKLEEAFRILTNGVIFDWRRANKLLFQSNFDKFLSSIQGFIIVK